MLLAFVCFLFACFLVFCVQLCFSLVLQSPMTRGNNWLLGIHEFADESQMSPVFEDPTFDGEPGENTLRPSPTRHQPPAAGKKTSSPLPTKRRLANSANNPELPSKRHSISSLPMESTAATTMAVVPSPGRLSYQESSCEEQSPPGSGQRAKVKR